MDEDEVRPPFWIDWEYDRENADPHSGSRYGNYLLARTDLFREIDYDDPSVEFACQAWRIATGPVMSPPLIRSHDRISGAVVSRSHWDGEASAEVTLISPRPSPLQAVRTTSGVHYRDWRRAYSGYYEPISEEDAARYPFLLTTVQILLPVPAGTVPHINIVPVSSGGLLDLATDSITALVEYLNWQIRPVLDQIDGG